MEPAVQKIDNEGTDGHTQDEARPDIRAWVEWPQEQNVTNVTNANANSQKKSNC